jgi:antitoxin MazE
LTLGDGTHKIYITLNVEALGLKEGDDIEIHVAGRRMFEIERAPAAQELLRRLRKFRGRLPAGFRFDRLEANERR